MWGNFFFKTKNQSTLKSKNHGDFQTLVKAKSRDMHLNYLGPVSKAQSSSCFSPSWIPHRVVEGTWLYWLMAWPLYNWKGRKHCLLEWQATFPFHSSLRFEGLKRGILDQKHINILFWLSTFNFFFFFFSWSISYWQTRMLWASQVRQGKIYCPI